MKDLHSKSQPLNSLQWPVYISNPVVNTTLPNTITITFPYKQTKVKHDMYKFDHTQFEQRIQNLITYWWIGKSSMYFFLILSF